MSDKKQNKRNNKNYDEDYNLNNDLGFSRRRRLK